MSKNQCSRAILLCGSNVGDRFNQLRLSKKLLAYSSDIQILKSSSIYETAPWGDTDQDAFLNQALLIETALRPEKLLVHLKMIEKEAGRINTRKWGPRALDIDILYYDKLIMKSDALSIPHLEVQDRAFALIPAAEIAPLWIDPRLEQDIQSLANACKDQLAVEKIALNENAL